MTEVIELVVDDVLSVLEVIDVPVVDDMLLILVDDVLVSGVVVVLTVIPVVEVPDVVVEVALPITRIISHALTININLTLSRKCEILTIHRFILGTIINDDSSITKRTE